jgi:hypothetical protein
VGQINAKASGSTPSLQHRESQESHQTRSEQEKPATGTLSLETQQHDADPANLGVMPTAPTAAWTRQALTIY